MTKTAAHAYRQEVTLKNRLVTKRLIGILSAVAAILLLFVWQHIQAVRLGYEVQSLRQQISAQQNANNILRLKIHSYASLNRLDELAKTRLGLVLPSKDDIVMVTVRDKEPPLVALQQASLVRAHPETQ